MQGVLSLRHGEHRDLPQGLKRLRRNRDMARYKLIGAIIEGQDVNQSTPSHDEQVSELRDAVVYETDDVAEGATVVSAGGYYRDRDNCVGVSRAADSDSPSPTAAPFPQKG